MLESSMGSFDFENVKIEKDGFTFSWTPGGTSLDCEMKLQDDQSYKGICKDSSGGEGHLTMSPPE